MTRAPRERGSERGRRRIVTRAALVALTLTAIAWLAASWHYDLDPVSFAERSGRLCAARALAAWHHADSAEADRLRAAYRIGGARLESEFVYEDAEHPALVRLRETYGLDELARPRPGDARDAGLLRLGTWAGTRFDHGNDPLPQAAPGEELVALVRAGAEGSRFLCDTAAKLCVQAAAAVGIPARLLTLSDDGYERDHAVAELWSDESSAWLVVDCDYLLCFRGPEGRLLGAWELCHDGARLAAAGRLQAVPLAPLKAGIRDPGARSLERMLPYYASVHVHLRNDWLSRQLPRGSPEGGDRATLWTARPGREPRLSAMRRAATRRDFEWPCNELSTRYESETGTLLLSTYSPYFVRFELSTGEGRWRQVEGKSWKLPAGSDPSSLEFRIRTRRDT